MWRYWVDNRTHREIGYNVFIRGAVLFGDSAVKDFGRGFPRYDFCVAVSEKQQEKLALRIGDVVRGTGWTPKYPNEEFADLYRAVALRVIERADHVDEPEVAVVADVERSGRDLVLRVRAVCANAGAS